MIEEKRGRKRWRKEGEWKGRRKEIDENLRERRKKKRLRSFGT